MGKRQSHIEGINRAEIYLLMFVNEVRGDNFFWTSFKVNNGMIPLLKKALIYVMQKSRYFLLERGWSTM